MNLNEYNKALRTVIFGTCIIAAMVLFILGMPIKLMPVCVIMCFPLYKINKNDKYDTLTSIVLLYISLMPLILLYIGIVELFIALFPALSGVLNYKLPLI